MNNKRILVISDMHIPYHHKDSIKFLSEIKKQFKPDRIINIGDSIDFHAISMHDSNPDLPNAGDELNLTRNLKHISQLKEKLIRSLVKKFLYIKTSLFHKLLKNISLERKSNG